MCVNSASTVLGGAGDNNESKAKMGLGTHVVVACDEASIKDSPWMRCFRQRSRSTRLKAKEKMNFNLTLTRIMDSNYAELVLTHLLSP